MNYYAIINEDGLCIGTMGSICNQEIENYIYIGEEEDNSYIGKVYADEVWSKTATIIEEVTEPTVTLESLSTKIEQLTKILEENNITI